MEESGILKIIIPELLLCRGIKQKGYHDFDVLDHLYYSCDGGPAEDTLIRLACLLHDIGKPHSLSKDEKAFPTFYNHEKFSANMSTIIMNRLRFSGKDIKRVNHLITNHMFNYTEDWTNAAVRRFISKVGVDNINDLFRLRLADHFGMTNSIKDSAYLYKFADRISILLESESTFSIQDLAISGTDLQIEGGIRKGPVIGTILRELLETVLDDPKLNNKNTLLSIAQNIYKNYIEN